MLLSIFSQCGNDSANSPLYTIDIKYIANTLYAAINKGDQTQRYDLLGNNINDIVQKAGIFHHCRTMLLNQSFTNETTRCRFSDLLRITMYHLRR